jgi:superfamily II DNA/RNA helicase
VKRKTFRFFRCIDTSFLLRIFLRILRNMFQVGRFDPREEDRKNDQSRLSQKSRDNLKKDQTDAATSKKEKKHKRKSTESSGHRKKLHRESEKDENMVQKEESKKISTLRVIAPETKGPSSSTRNLNTKLSEEAFDDLDITDDFIQEGESTDGPDGLLEVEGEPGTAVDPLSNFDPTDEIQRALHMARQPIHSAAQGWGLAPFLVANLERDGYESFFPIQALVIPDVIAAERHTHMQARDICVAAPTG